jgi:hypothetical protein
VFFNRYYHRTYTKDILRLQQDLAYIYNKFVERYPRVYVVTPGSLKCPFKTDRGTWQGPLPAGTYHTTTIERTPVTVAELQSLGGTFWLDLYFKMRLREERIAFSEYDKRLEKAIQIYRAFTGDASQAGQLNFQALDNNRTRAFRRATRFINNEVKPYLYSKYLLPKKALTKEATFVSMNSISSE